MFVETSSKRGNKIPCTPPYDLSCLSNCSCTTTLSRDIPTILKYIKVWDDTKYIRHFTFKLYNQLPAANAMKTFPDFF